MYKIIELLRETFHYIQKKRNDHYLEELIKKGLYLGKNVEIIDNYFFDPSHCYLISIGDDCTICPNVRLVAHDASTKKFLGYTKIGKIVIKENCFIGDSVIVLPNVTIGPNSIVGAGSVVTKNIPPNAVAAGSPAKVISSLDQYLEKIKTAGSGKRVFGDDYIIRKLDEKKKKEIIESVSNTIGFIK